MGRLIIFSLVLFLLFDDKVLSQSNNVRTVAVGEGWAGNSVNAVIFRKNSLVSFKSFQFISYYDADGFLILGRRKLNSDQWELKRTVYKGNITDAHNDISIILDGDGYLHVSWDHHNNPLRYSRSKAPFSLELSDKMPMTGLVEQSVSYPEFYSLPDGNLLFFYRNGASGRGNLVINKYDKKTQKWSQLHSNLIDGEGKRSAYWQACVDKKGGIHISWVWRESADVASNHDMCYVWSADGGKTWQKSTGELYNLPITASNAEYACQIPQKSELINQTSMFADASGNPFIASYWRESNDSVPQYHLIYKENQQWKVLNTNFRKTPFSLSGVGTKRIPVSRPQIISWTAAKKQAVALIFRDEERNSKISMAFCRNLQNAEWQVTDMLDESVGLWEPTYDTELWKNRQILHLFVEKVEQADAEGKSNQPPQKVKVLEWHPAKNVQK
jgi:hypothetical protein